MDFFIFVFVGELEIMGSRGREKGLWVGKEDWKQRERGLEVE